MDEDEDELEAKVRSIVSIKVAKAAIGATLDLVRSEIKIAGPGTASGHLRIALDKLYDASDHLDDYSRVRA